MDCTGERHTERDIEKNRLQRLSFYRCVRLFAYAKTTMCDAGNNRRSHLPKIAQVAAAAWFFVSVIQLHWSGVCSQRAHKKYKQRIDAHCAYKMYIIIECVVDCKSNLTCLSSAELQRASDNRCMSHRNHNGEIGYDEATRRWGIFNHVENFVIDYDEWWWYEQRLSLSWVENWNISPAAQVNKAEATSLSYSVDDGWSNAPNLCW